MNDVLFQVKKTIESHRLIVPGDGVLVAVSGGADSVCLLHLLCRLQDELGFSLCAAHLNHGLRGAEADEDEAFVKALCDSLSVPLFARTEDVRHLAELRDVSLELAGREARYAFFEEILKKHNLQKVATAHHADDNIETVLMRLMRGTGMTGLAGIPYQNGNVIRPLLDVSRQEAEAYLKEQGLSYRTDSTNQSTEFTRNRVRHNLLPMIEQEFNPNFRRNFQGQINVYADCAAFISGEVETIKNKLEEQISGGVCYDCDALSKESPFLVSQLYHRVIEELSCERETGLLAVRAVEDIVRKKQGRVSLCKNLMAEICYGKLYIRWETVGTPFSYELETELTVPENGDRFLVTKGETVPATFEANKIYLDAEKLAGKQLRVRSRKQGDFFSPVGMDGRKTLQDFFVDCKVPHFVRDSIPLVAADEDIIWVAGMRADGRFVAAKGQKNAICITYFGGNKS